MNAKKITTLALLIFVVASVGTIVAKERGAQKPIVESAPQTVTTTSTESPNTPIPQQTASAVAPVAASEKAAPAKVVAYYFHGNYRCPTCRKIEALTTEAIQGGFEQAIKDGSVELKVVNVEESGNEHYVQDFQLANRSVVVARYEGDNQKDWKRLDEVWQLVGNHDAFIAFVREKTSELLKANGV